MNLNEASRIVRQAIEPLSDADPEWERAFSKVFDAIAERERSGAVDRKDQDAQIKAVELLASVAGLLEDQSQSSEERVKDAFQQIDHLSRNRTFIGVRHPGLEKERPDHPLRILYWLNWPVARYDGLSVTFSLPCCMSSVSTLNLPDEYAQLMTYLRREREVRHSHSKPDPLLDETDLLQMELLQRVRGGEPGQLTWQAQAFREAAAKGWERPPNTEEAIEFFERQPGIWLLPLFDEHEFYRVAVVLYEMAATASRQRGECNDVYIIATSPGTLRPDEYYGPFVHTSLRDAEPGAFHRSAIERNRPDEVTFAAACGSIYERFRSNPTVERKSINRPLYFDNGIGSKHPDISKVYITTGTSDRDAQAKPGVDGPRYTMRIAGSTSDRHLEIDTSDEDLARKALRLSHHFITENRIRLHLPDNLFNDAQGKWYRYMTLTGKRHWLMSARGTRGTKRFISHGFLLNLELLKECATGEKQRYRDVVCHLATALDAWGMSLNVGQDDPASAIDEIADRVYGEVGRLATDATRAGPLTWSHG